LRRLGISLATLALLAISIFGPPPLQAQPLSAEPDALGRNAPGEVMKRRPQVQLSAQASMEVMADTLTITLRAQKQSSEATKAQSQVKQLLEAALVEARKQARAPGLEVRSGSFSTSPRYGNNGGILGWQSQGDLILSGTDTAQVAALAGRLNGLQVTGSGYSVSPALRERHERELMAQAIERFRLRADEVARGFGYGAYEVNEVTVSDAGIERPMPRLAMAMAMSERSAADAAPLPVEPGTERLAATVNGSIWLLRTR
jgi:predicted secreted protein